MSARAIPSIVLREIETLGLPWRVEVGRGHCKLYVAGRLEGVPGVNLQDADRRAALNVRAQVRRIAARAAA